VKLATVSFTRAARSSRKIVILSVSLALVLKDSHWPWPWTNVLGLGLEGKSLLTTLNIMRFNTIFDNLVVVYFSSATL